MKRTIDIEVWDIDSLLYAVNQTDSCTIQELIDYLTTVMGRSSEEELENIRLVARCADTCGMCSQADLALVGDREETDEERQHREDQAAKMERRVLLDYISEHHRPQLRNENQEKWRQDCAVMIQQKGWDKLPLEELRQLARSVV